MLFAVKKGAYNDEVSGFTRTREFSKLTNLGCLGIWDAQREVFYNILTLNPIFVSI